MCVSAMEVGASSLLSILNEPLCLNLQRKKSCWAQVANGLEAASHLHVSAQCQSELQTFW